jgi:uncharacterized protein YjbJ (UPF0337 family)
MMTMPRVFATGLFSSLVVAMATTGFAGDFKPVPGSISADYTVVKVLNQDQFEGNWKQFKGDLKKKWGKFTDDDLLMIEGNYDKFEGKLQERYGDKKEQVQKWTDEWFEKNTKK